LSRRAADPAVEAERKAQQERLFALDVDRIMSGEDKRTTLMIKNIPNKYTQKMLLQVRCVAGCLQCLCIDVGVCAWHNWQFQLDHERWASAGAGVTLAVGVRASCCWCAARVRCFSFCSAN
jgi:hypothetical protein